MDAVGACADFRSLVLAAELLFPVAGAGGDRLHGFHGLALAASAQGSAEEGSRRQEELEAHVRQFQVWVENCPENFSGKHALLAAELARLREQPLEAMRLYEQALRATKANGFVQDEALAYELTARFYLAQGLEAFGRDSLREARACYARWGATGKVEWLARHYPRLA